jgi:ectoine hydroxylase-related dioxygenase (phytanoyl-CoA dioxygenase family)
MFKMALTTAQKDFFDHNGYVVIRQLFSDEAIQPLRQRADEIATGKAPHVPDDCVQVEPKIQHGEVTVEDRVLSIRKLYKLHWVDDVMQAHATHPKIVDIIEDLFDWPNIKVYNDQLFMKAPQHGSRQGYHQDSQSWKQWIFPHDLISCWAALDDATIENGCLWMIPGSHKSGLLDRERLREIEQMAQEEKLGEAGLREDPVELKAGDCSFHHSLTLHCSHANRSSRRRRGYATHYMRSESQYVGTDKKPKYILVRGREFAGCV